MKRLILSFITIAAISTTVFAASGAFFSDTETSTDNTFVAGAIDLLIDSTCHYWQNGVDVGCGDGSMYGNWQATNLNESHRFFNFADLKPGDSGEDTVSLRVDNNNAWVCSDITLTSSPENGFTEPESLLDNTSFDGPHDGELAGELNFFIWGDDGDNVLEDDEFAHGVRTGSLANLVGSESVYHLSLADSANNIWGDPIGQPLPGTQTRYLGVAWCFGTIASNPVDQGVGDPSTDPGFTCNGTLVANISQTDSVTGDISFTATQARNQPDFLCQGNPQCTLQQVFTTYVISHNQGTLKNGQPITDPLRIDPDKANGPTDNLFYSLGFKSQTSTASATLKFTGPVGMGAGDDLLIHEVTLGRDTYPEEKAKVEVSQDNITWYLAGTATSKDTAGFTSFDLDALPISTFQYVRVTDQTDPNLFTTRPTADGYDLDAIEAAYGACTF